MSGRYAITRAARMRQEQRNAKGQRRSKPNGQTQPWRSGAQPVDGRRSRRVGGKESARKVRGHLPGVPSRHGQTRRMGRTGEAPSFGGLARERAIEIGAQHMARNTGLSFHCKDALMGNFGPLQHSGRRNAEPARQFAGSADPCNGDFKRREVRFHAAI